MFKNYLKIAIRNLLRLKLYSFINISGLAVGIACSILILLYVLDELSYDRYHENADQIYRLVSDLKTPDKTFPFAITPADMAPALREDFPEVLNTVRLRRVSGVMQYGDKQFQENLIFLADSSLFEIFTFPLKKGDPKTALKEPFSLVLTEKTARKYFGDADPMGKELVSENDPQPYRITGLIAEVPRNSHFTFDMLISNSTLEAIVGPRTEPRWFSFNSYTYLLLPKSYPFQELEAKLADFVERRMGEVQRQAGQSHTLSLQPLTDIHLRSQRDNEAGTNGNLAYLYIFSAIALFILLIACINFVNLATALAFKRAKEVGIRKVVGAQRWQLAKQFLGESFFASFLAFLFAVQLILLLLPVIEQLAGKTLDPVLFYRSAYGALLPGLVLLVGLLAGSYPAFVISGFRPTTVLKGVLRSGRQGVALRKSLVVFQLTVSIVLLVGTFVVQAQLDHLQQQNLGFNKEQMLVVNFYGDSQVRNNYERIKAELHKHPAVVAATVSYSTPGVRPINWYTEYETSNGQMQNSSLDTYVIDTDFIHTYGMEMAAGRSFSKTFATDSTAAYMINEAAVPYFGWTSPREAIGKRFVQNGTPGRIIGVVKNFNFRSLHRQVEPLAFQIRPNMFSRISLRLQSDNLIETVAKLEQTWNGLVPHRSFDFTFLDESLDQQYRTEIRVGQLFNYFSAIAILIACLGLFGLASFMAEERTKEIGVRKVLGATISTIVSTLSMEFVKLVAIGFVIAVPLAYYGMNRWLQNFAYRTEISASEFVLSGSLILIVAWLTVSYHSIKAALTNPVQALKYE